MPSYYKYVSFAVLLMAAAQAAEPPTVIVTGKPRLRPRPVGTAEFEGESLPMPRTANPSLSRALRESPAVMVRESGGESSPPSYVIRGLDPVQNRYFLEGVPLTDAEFHGGNLHLVPVDALSGSDIYAEGIPVFLGQDGLGGAINLRLDPLEAQSAVAARAGALGFWNVSGESSLDHPSLRLHIDARGSRENFSYFDDNGTPFNPSDDRTSQRDNNDFRRLTLLPRVRLWESGQHRVDWISLSAISENGVPGSTSVPLGARLAQVFHLSALKHEGTLSEDVSTESYGFLRVSEDKLTGGETSALLIPSSRATDVAGGAKFRARAQVAGQSLDLLMGAGIERFQARTERGTATEVENRRLELPLGISSSGEWGSLRLRPAVLTHYYEYRRLGDTGTDRSYFLASPRAGISWELAPEWRFRASLGRYYRAPSMLEIFGSPAGITPSPDLIPETADKLDAGVDVELARSVRLSYTFSVVRARDLIAFLVNSQSSRIATNIAEALIQAHELGAELRPKGSAISVRGALALLVPVNRSDVSYQNGKTLPNRPPYRGELGLRYEEERWAIGYSLSLTGPMFSDLANAQRRSAVSEHGVYGEWSTRSMGSFGVEVRNLTDALTSATESGGYQWLDSTTGYPGYPAPGRRWYVSWKNAF